MTETMTGTISALKSSTKSCKFFWHVCDFVSKS